MREAEVFIALLAAVMAVVVLARGLPFPQPVGLVLGGFAIGALPITPDVRLEPELILLVFLPPILYPAASQYAAEDVRSNVTAVGLLAVGLVAATIAVVAAVAHLVAGIPWASAFVLGAILGPTDPIAATTLVRRLGAPERIATILEGESLINDGTALTAFRIAVGAVGGSFALGSAAGEFVVVVAGGSLVGAAVAVVSSWLRSRLEDPAVESAISVLTAYGSYVLAEEVGASGILAVVVAGYVMGHRRAFVSSPETRLQAGSFWDVLRLLAESMLFVLVGAVFVDVVDATGSLGPLELAGTIALLAAATVAVRVAWMFTVPFLAGALSTRRGSFTALVGPPELGAIAGGGMRGAVSVAAALAIPVSVGGTAFAGRDTVLVLAIGTVVVLLVVPALAFAPLLRLLGLEQPEEQRRRGARARARVTHAALERMEDLAVHEEVPEALVQRVRERYERRLAGLQTELGDEALAADGDDGAQADAQAYADLRRRLIAAEREALEELSRTGEVSGEALLGVQRDLDLEESRLGR